MLDSIARALRMDATATAYLHELARPARPAGPDGERVPEAIVELVAQFPMPAIVVNRYQDVLVANAIACAVSPGFEVGQNLSLWRFLDPAAKQVYPDWNEATALSVGGLRELSASDPDDPRLIAMIDELCSHSQRFRDLWSRADVGYVKGVNHMRHPVVGDLYLTRSKLDLPHCGGAHVLTFHAEPGSASAHALDRLREGLPAHSG